MLPARVKLAARNVLRHRTRSLISLSAIAFGVVALLLASGFIEWIYYAIREAAIQKGMGHIQVTRAGFRDAGLADPRRYLLPAGAPELAIVRSAPHVVVVEERLMLSGLASSGEITLPFAGEAVEPQAERTLSRILPITGENLDGGDRKGVLLGHGLAAALGVKQGDVVSFIASVPGGGINAVEGHVLGLFNTSIKAYDDVGVRMPLSLGRELLRTQGAHAWVVALQDTADTEETAAWLRAHLPPAYEVRTWLELSDFYRKSVSLLSRQVDVVVILIGIIIVLGIANALTMNVLERTGEIGTVMALGTSRRQVLGAFLLEGLLLGAMGAVLGLVIGYLLALAISYVGIPMPPPPGRTEGYSAEIILTSSMAWRALALGVVSAVLAAVYPAWKAARLPIVDALRHNR